MCANHAAAEWRVALSNDGALTIAPATDVQSRQSFQVANGVLEGWDNGEFGGGISFRSKSGSSDTLTTENLRSFIQTREGVRALVGLAHLSFDRGKLLALEPAPDGHWRARELIDLQSAPQTFVAVDSDTLLIVTSKSVLQVVTGRVNKLFESKLWWGLYPNSVARDKAGTIYIGMRGGVTHLQPIPHGFREDWLLPDACGTPCCRPAR
jgi:hypothetical protein